MRSNRRRLMRFASLIVALTAGLVVTPAARAEVIDHAHLFSADAAAQANKVIAEIQSRDHLKLTVETFPEIPADKQPEFDAARGDQTATNDFYKRWAEERLS